MLSICSFAGIVLKKWFVMDSDKEYIEEEEVLFDDYSSSYI